MFSYFDMQYQTMISYNNMNKYVFRKGMEKNFAFVTCSPASVEASRVSGTVNEVISRSGLLVWMESCVGFMFCVFPFVHTSSSSLSSKPEGNKESTCTVLYRTTLLYWYTLKQKEYLKNKTAFTVAYISTV